MALHSSLSLAVLSLCALVLVIEPHGALGSSRGSFGLTSNVVTNGICAIGVLVRGYNCQEFEVTTDDGYILSVQRIPGGGGGGGNKQPVLLQHGLMANGMSWLEDGPGLSLAFILADSGYDVWISNVRGTTFSRRHVTLDINNPEYWDWTWDELANHDLPAVIGLVFNQTGQRVHYVGHSLGTLMGLASLSERKLVDQMRSAALLCPIFYLGHRPAAAGLGAVAATSAAVGDTSLVQSSLLAAGEFNPLGDASAVNPFGTQSTSVKNLMHLAQLGVQGFVAKYDYGNPVLNEQHYGGEARPPVYHPENIPSDFPLFIAYGGLDTLSVVVDVHSLLHHLRGHKLNALFVPNYGHLDFIFSPTAKDVVYNPLVSFFQRHQ